MNLLAILHDTVDSSASRDLARAIGSDPQLFAQLMAIFLHQPPPLPHRAAWVILHGHHQQPDLLTSYLPQLCWRLHTPPLPPSLKRNIFRFLEQVELPQALQEHLIAPCFDALADPREAVGIRVYAMGILATLCHDHPELRHELRLLIEAHMPYASKGFAARGRRVLKQLDRLESP